MNDGFAVVTLCTGNVHRSALAASLLRQWAGWYLNRDLAATVSVASAGFAAPVGAPMGDRVLTIARALGADGSTHRAAQVDDRLLSGADLVLVASRRQLEKVLNRTPSAVRKTFTIREAGRIAEGIEAAPPASPRDLRRVVQRLADLRGGAAIEAEDDIIDPQGLGEAAYLQMVQEEVGALARLAVPLLGMPRADMDAYLAAAEDPSALLRSTGGVGVSE
jgi:protein-tyrosine phosphatase